MYFFLILQILLIGKSFCLKSIRGLIHERSIKHKLLTFTGRIQNALLPHHIKTNSLLGAAAAAIQGQTVHNIMRIGYYQDLNIIPTETKSNDHLKNIKFYLFDEIYMLGRRLLHFFFRTFKNFTQL